VRLACSQPCDRFAEEHDCVGAFAVGKISEEERKDVILHACPGM
jgi:hypothetical protein